ncbi:Probable terpene synthase 3 [Linum perenne]
MLYLIDAIERLGVEYHFEEEIKQILQGIYHHTFPTTTDLNTTALSFRLLRQHGYNVPSDVFIKFKEGKQFKKELANDLEGMLNLYEAAYMRTREESILDEATEFTKEELNAKGVELAATSPHLFERIDRALKRPLRKVVEKVEHLFFISMYERLDNHDHSLLKLAKLNFNVLQNLYQTELRLLTKWWIELDTPAKLPYARDKLVESYFWALGTMWEPKYSLARQFLTKITQIGTLLDDTYDVHGTIDELELFTSSIRRYIVDNVVTLYLEEMRWFDQDRVPTLEEYRQVSSLSTCYEWMIYSGLCGMGESISKDVFNWLFSKPKILIATTDLCRLMDDIVSNEFEQERGHVASSVECIMKQHSVSREEAIDMLNNIVEEDWKIMNEELLNPPVDVPNDILQIFLRLGHIMDILYKETDGYTNSNTTTHDMLTALLLTPFPIIISS